MYGAHWHFGGRGGPFGRPPRPGRPDFSELFGGSPPRADRGVVRYLVLDAIGKQPRHGYEIIQAIEERSAGTYRPSPGVVYPTLQMLEELGHARLEVSDARNALRAASEGNAEPVRKVYAITQEGKDDLKAHAGEVEDFYEDAGEGSWDDFADELRDLTHRIGKMFKSIGRSARRGRLTPSTMKRLRVVLDDAIAKIEVIVGADGRD